MTVRPTPESYIPEFSKLKTSENESDDVMVLESLVSIGGYITAYAAPDTAAAFGRISPYFHHDLRRLFAEWCGAGRRVLKRDKNLFAEEIDVLEESGEIHSSPLTQEDPDFGSQYANELLLGIQRETSRRLGTLRIAKKKAEEDAVQRIARSQPIEFDTETSKLYIQGKSVDIDKRMLHKTSGGLEHQMLAILFSQETKSMPCDEFWAKWREQLVEDYTVADWHNIVATADRINKKCAIATKGKVVAVVTDFISISLELLDS